MRVWDAAIGGDSQHNPLAGMIRRFFRVLAAVLLLSGGYTAVAEAKTGLALLTEAAKLIDKNDHGSAIQKIEEAFRAGDLDFEASAKAYVMRAQCHEKQGRQALALADYTSALFMQSLSNTDRKVATDGQSRMRAALGLGGDQTASRTPAQGGERRAAPAQAETASPAPERTASGGGVSGFFGGLFSSSPTSADAKPETKPTTPSFERTARVAVPAPAADAPPARQAAAPSRPASEPKPAAPVSDGRLFDIHLATVSTEADAQSEVLRFTTRLSEFLEGKTPEITRVERGGNTLYRVIAGPYEGGVRSRALCEGMKTKGVSCVVVAR